MLKYSGSMTAQAEQMQEVVQGRYGGVGLVISTPPKPPAPAKVPSSRSTSLPSPTNVPSSSPRPANEDNGESVEPISRAAAPMKDFVSPVPPSSSLLDALPSRNKAAQQNKDEATSRPSGVLVVNAFEGYAFNQGMRVGDRLVSVRQEYMQQAMLQLLCNSTCRDVSCNSFGRCISCTDLILIFFAFFRLLFIKSSHLFVFHAVTYLAVLRSAFMPHPHPNIYKVGGVDVRGSTSEKVRNLLRGSPDSTVKVRFERDALRPIADPNPEDLSMLTEIGTGDNDGSEMVAGKNRKGPRTFEVDLPRTEVTCRMRVA